jgi:hypothetical protein
VAELTDFPVAATFFVARSGVCVASRFASLSKFMNFHRLVNARAVNLFIVASGIFRLFSWG